MIEKFNGWAYLGFSGFIRGNRDLELRDAYICEDVNYKSVRAKVNLLRDRKNPQEVNTAAPNETLVVSFAFFNRDDRVPHMIGEMNEYNISVTTSCGTIAGPFVVDIYTLSAEVL